MPRRSHTIKSEEEAQEDMRRIHQLRLPPELSDFLDVEAKRETDRKKKRVRPADIIRALIVAYYEKRLAGLLVSPDD